MFQCDPSQLPDEQLSFSHTSSLEQVCLVDAQPQPQPQQPSTSEQPTYQAEALESITEAPKRTPVAPSLVVVESASSEPCADFYLQNVNGDSTARDEEIPERPVSRRGSYSRDDLLDKVMSPPPPLASELIAESQVTRSRTAHKFGHWSSDSEEEGETEGYHKLSEPEDDDQEPELRKVISTDESEKENNEEFEDNLGENAHVYERLDESNSPSPSPLRETSSSSPFMV